MKRYLSICNAIYIGITFCLTSCVMVPPPAVKKDNGKHLGWYKNTNNPHNAFTTNPGHTKAVAKGNPKMNRPSNGRGGKK